MSGGLIMWLETSDAVVLGRLCSRKRVFKERSVSPICLSTLFSGSFALACNTGPVMSFFSVLSFDETSICRKVRVGLKKTLMP